MNKCVHCEIFKNCKFNYCGVCGKRLSEGDMVKFNLYPKSFSETWTSNSSEYKKPLHCSTSSSI